MQADRLSESGTPMTVVLPLTTRIYPEFSRWRITIPARERLLKGCQVVVDQPRSLDPARLSEGPLTRLTNEEMARVMKRTAPKSLLSARRRIKVWIKAHRHLPGRVPSLRR